MAEKPGGEPGRRSTARSESARLVSKAVGRRGGAMVDMHDGERERGDTRSTTFSSRIRDKSLSVRNS